MGEGRKGAGDQRRLHKAARAGGTGEGREAGAGGHGMHGRGTRQRYSTFAGASANHLCFNMIGGVHCAARTIRKNNKWSRALSELRKLRGFNDGACRDVVLKRGRGLLKEVSRLKRYALLPCSFEKSRLVLCRHQPARSSALTRIGPPINAGDIDAEPIGHDLVPTTFANDVFCRVAHSAIICAFRKR